MSEFTQSIVCNDLQILDGATFSSVKNAYLKTDGNGAVIATENPDDGSSPDAGGTIGAKVGRFDKINRYNEGDTGVIEIPNVYVPVELQSDNLTARGNTYMYGDVTFTDGTSDKEKGDIIFEKQPLFEKGIRSYNASANPLITAEYHQITGQNTSGFVAPDPSRQDDGPKLVVGYRPESSNGGKGKLQLLVGDSDYNGIGKGKWIVLAQQDVKRRGVPSSGTDDIEPYTLDSVLLEPTDPNTSGTRKLLLRYDNQMGALTTSIYDTADGSITGTTAVAQVSAAGTYNDVYTENITGDNFISFKVNGGPEHQPVEKFYVTSNAFYASQSTPFMLGGTIQKSPCLTTQVDNQITHVDGNDIYDDNRNLSVINGQKGIAAFSFRENCANDGNGDVHLCDLIHDGTTDLFKIVLTSPGNPLKTVLTLDGTSLNTITQGLVVKGTSTLQNTNVTNLNVSKDTTLAGNLTVSGNGLVRLNNVPLTVDGDTTLGRNVGISNVNTSFTVASKSTFNNTVTVNAPLNTTGFISSGNVYMRLPGVLQNNIVRLQPINWNANQSIIYPQSQLNLNPYSLDGNGRFSVGQPGIFQIEANLYVPSPNQASGSRIYGLLLYNQTTGSVVVYNNYSGQIREAFTFSATIYLDRATTYYMTIQADSTSGASPNYAISGDGTLNWFSIYRLA